MPAFEYIAMLGRQPELGFVELEAVLGTDGVQPFGRAAALCREAPPINGFGGVVKLGRILYDGPAVNLRPLPIDTAQLPMGGAKTPFAISVYGLRATRRFVEAAGLALKKDLRVRGPVRLVVPADGTEVTAAQLHHNRVLEDGFELLVVVAGQRMVVARTMVVQDIDWYSRRDYGRPARSAKVGMLPPKLAQVLVNTTKPGAVVADPFCGSGVVLAEALLAGRVAHGSDASPEMVAAARANLAWLGAEVRERAAGGGAAAAAETTLLPAWSVEPGDARTVKLAAGCAVVTEGYLGTPQVHSPTPDELAKLRSELLDLYRESLANWARQLPTGAEVSLCVPAWRVGKRWHYLGVVDELAKLGYTQKVFKHATTPLLYAREGQVVGRQLLFLAKG